jgi:hypothetical protein
MVDPVVVCPPPINDKFLGLTSTAWTAIGLFVSALSVIALVIYNWIYLRLARNQTNAAMTQARVALSTLDSLQRQLSDQQEFERHSALAVLQETNTQVIFWREHANTEWRPETNPVQLLPDDWSVLAIYTSRRVPNLVSKLRLAGHNLREAENLLNRIVQTPVRDRGGNCSITQILDSLNQQLDQIKVALDTLEKSFPKAIVIPG